MWDRSINKNFLGTPQMQTIVLLAKVMNPQIKVMPAIISSYACYFWYGIMKSNGRITQWLTIFVYRAVDCSQFPRCQKNQKTENSDNPNFDTNCFLLPPSVYPNSHDQVYQANFKLIFLEVCKKHLLFLHTGVIITGLIICFSVT